LHSDSPNGRDTLIGAALEKARAKIGITSRVTFCDGLKKSYHIQAGINAASNGDSILVSPGTYNENINFLGKAITVKSTNGRAVTTITSNGGGSTVTFSGGEGPASILNGFTVVGDTNNTVGIGINSTSPTILNNKITGNHSCDGAGISVSFGSPLISGNVITGNFHDLCSGGVGGGGIAVVGAGNAQIIGNVISNNNAGNGVGGGGISLFASGTPTIMNNIISNNTAVAGGAISMVNQSDANIIQNLIYNNAASQGSGIYFLVPFGDRGPLLVNNTIVGGIGTTQGTAVFASGFDSNVQFYNNLLIGLSGQNAVDCDNTYSSTPPTFSKNDAFSPSGTGLQGTCASQSNQNGNLSVDPQFVSKSNYRLNGGSAVIDVGSNSAPSLPNKDLATNPRIVNGNGGPTAIVDMGAYEFLPVVVTPKSLSFGLQAVGSTTIKTITLTNAQNKSLSISSRTHPIGYSVSGCGTTVAAFSNCILTVTFHPLTSGSFNGTLTIKDDAGKSPQSVSLLGSAH
jgi:hypothetical protein